MRDVLVVMALQEEELGLLQAAGAAVLFTGVGKVNAALQLMRYLTAQRLAGTPVRQVLNVGTAGSRRFATGSLVGCHRFVQRDMDVSPLGFARGTTPFEAQWGGELVFEPAFAQLPQGLCGTGDSFDTGAHALHCDVLEMEAYALAKVCLHEGVGFACAKYISDGADHASATDWAAALPAAAAAFASLYRQLAHS
jgi:adenosylhomocysteine nucleosidase